MARAVAVFCLFVLVTVWGGVARAEFDPPGLANDASAYAAALMAKAPPQITPQQRANALKQARATFDKKEWAKALTAYEQAVTLGVDDTPSWLAISELWMTIPKPNRDRALQAAFLAYRANMGPEQLSAALWRAVALLDEVFHRPDQALAAAREIAEYGAPVAGLEDRIKVLRQRVGLTVRNLRVSSEELEPRLCVTFSDPLSDRKGIRFEDFVAVEPAVRMAVDARDDTLCIAGFSHGASYTVTLRQGLPGADGLALKKDETHRIRVGDRPPVVAFRGSSFILPRGSAEGVPVVTVNVDSVAVKLLRVNDRALAELMRDDRLLEPLYPYLVERFADSDGELVWQGRMDVRNEPNRDVVTALPFRELVAEPKPGLYIVVAEPVDVPSDELPHPRATQWLLVSDIGLTAMRGADGITVFARSFGTAKPMRGAEVVLLARNNKELGRATTDAHGHVNFPSPLTRGEGGNAPMAVMAYAGADFAVLDLLSPAFDLSDRGVGGRPAPGPMDAFLYTDRGVYRQGETVNLGILLRDDSTRAIEGFPLTVKVLRPSGTEYFAGPVPAGPAGAFVMPLTLSRTAPLGGWTVLAYADPKGEPIGKATFQVDDFVPERLAVEVTPSVPFLVPGTPADLLVKGRFLYGPPAAGLGGTAELSVQPDPDPYPQLKGYRFGMVQDNPTPRLQRLDFPTTDAQGEARVPVTLPALPDTTRPLRAEIRLTMAEPGGRPTRESLTLPIRAQPYAIGIRPRFEGGRIGEGQEAVFDMMAVAPDGTPIAKPGLSWELVEEVVTYNWFLQNGRYNYRAITRDVSRKAGGLDLAADKPATLALGPQSWGRFRLEVVDKATGIATSVRYGVGWQLAADSGDTPDKVEVVADKAAYKPGDTARVRITPPFAGEVLLTIATDRVFDAKTFSVSAGGTTVEIPVDAAWGPGAYVTATVYRPPVKGKERQPVRAIGVVWLGVDPAVRTLDVAFSAPEVVRPRQPVEIAMKVAPAAGTAEEAWVTLAAVDEGILQLTDFASPDPGRHYFGKRMLGLDIRDDYGRLIDALDGPFGALRQGGDTSGAALPVVPFTVVSLFRGPVKVGADGIAKVTLDIPDFNGQLRLMAVAFGKGRVGSGSGRLIVRDPLVAEAVMPRFLAPGDDSRLTLSLHNVEAPAGAYRVEVVGSGAVAVDGGAFTVDLPTGARRTVTLPFRGLTVGIGQVALSVKGPDGLAIDRSHGITVRSARPVVAEFTTRQLEPGGMVQLAAAQLAGFLPGTASLSATFGTAPPFDVAGILKALDRYPYGCLEQTISRALPLLVVNDVEKRFGTATDERAGDRVAQAVSRTLDKQRFDGSFGLWSARDDGEPWLTPYAMEFLVRARAKGVAVPDQPVTDGLQWLRQRAVDGGRDPEELAVRAYALHVLALAGVAAPGPTRYLFDTFLTDMPTPLAKGQLGAALARLGDRDRATEAFTAALRHLARNPWHADYGSTVRDAAALVSLMGEVGMLGDRLPVLLDRLPVSATAAAMTSTQEQAWLLLAADTLMKGKGPLDLAVGGAVLKADPVHLAPSAADLGAGVTVRNAGTRAVWQAVSLSGVPAQPRPAAHEGLRIKRHFFTRGGQPLNLDQIRQNDVFVIVLEGQANTGLYHQALVTHPLPAGWEIENARLGAGGVGDMPWLKDLTTPRTAEARDDRFVAAVDLDESTTTFKLAYLVRAVTPGGYELPGAMVEDMYKPRFFARQTVGRIQVLPAE